MKEKGDPDGVLWQRGARDKSSVIREEVEKGEKEERTPR